MKKTEAIGWLIKPKGQYTLKQAIYEKSRMGCELDARYWDGDSPIYLHDIHYYISPNTDVLSKSKPIAVIKEVEISLIRKFLKDHYICNEEELCYSPILEESSGNDLIDQEKLEKISIEHQKNLLKISDYKEELFDNIS